MGIEGRRCRTAHRTLGPESDPGPLHALDPVWRDCDGVWAMGAYAAFHGCERPILDSIFNSPTSAGFVLRAERGGAPAQVGFVDMGRYSPGMSLCCPSLAAAPATTVHLYAQSPMSIESSTL